ncbi:MAG TPA: hypothetical protein ENK19_00235, partial [Acidobacteria bacterium]|nr:hypothetical protein [Acidobacteriota bacterium]
MNPTRSLEAPTWAVGLAAILAVAVLWAYRTVVSMDVLAELLLPWLWLSVWTVAAWGAGGFLYRPAKRGTNATAMVARLALGSALLSLVATLLACIGGFRPGVLLAVLGAATVTGVAGLVRRRTVFLPTGHVPWP